MAIIKYAPAPWPTFWDEDQTEDTGLSVVEQDDEVKVTAPVPGLKADQVKVTYENGVLRISGENKQKYSFSSFDYETTLSRTIDVSKLKAELEDGVLTISAPIAPESKAKQITVTTKK